MNIPYISFGWNSRVGPCITIHNNEKNYGLCLCHRREDRSFKVHGHVFPVCARCTGIIVGFALAVLLLNIEYRVPSIYSVIFIIPLLMDGFSQSFGWRESNNLLRLLTGIVFGIGFMYIGEII